MKKTFILPILLIFLFSCSTKESKDLSSENDEQQQEKNNIGGNRDENDCLTSAGYTWSQIKNDCVQIFNVGDRLNPIDQKKDEAIISSFVIFNDDRTKCELFIEDKNVLLSKIDDHIYQSGKYKYDYNDCSLYIDGKRAYLLEK